MKKRVLALLLVTAMGISLFSACGKDTSTEKPETETSEVMTETEGQAVEPTEKIESTENVAATEVEGTEEEGTEVEGTEVEETEVVETVVYTYTDMSVVKYAQSSVNVRNLPSTEGEQIGSLTTNQEVTVTGQCNETSWYRIDYNGSVGYVSNNYLGDAMVEVQQQAAETTPVVDEVCPYPLYTIFYDTTGLPYFYGSYGGSANMDPAHYAMTESCMAQMDEYIRNNFRVENPDGTSTSSHVTSWKLIGTYSGLKVVVRYIDNLNGIPMGDPALRGIPTAGNGIY